MRLLIKNVGLGSNIPDRSGARVSLERDGTFLVRHGATDMGQGSNQMVATVAARVLGVPLRMVRVHTGDTREDPEGGMTTASRATFLSGNATLKASEGLRSMLWDTIASEFNVPDDDIEIREGVFVRRSTGKKLISLQELAKGSVTYSLSIFMTPLKQSRRQRIVRHIRKSRMHPCILLMILVFR